MDIYIKDLKISSTAKVALQSIGFTKLSELEGHNHITLAEIFPPNYNVESIVSELNTLGYLLPPDNEISIYEISISKRLQNILRRNNIIYLSQLSDCPVKEIMKFRNMGITTYKELKTICDKQGISIRSHDYIKKG